MAEGFKIYWPILSRIGETKPLGSNLIVFRCPFGSRHRNGDAHPSGRAKIGNAGQLVIRCFGCGANLKEFAEFVGFPARAFWPAAWMDGRPSEPQRQQREIMQQEVARYAYRSPTGELIAYKVRLEPGRDGRKKDFAWELPLDPLLVQAAGLPEGSIGHARALCGGDFYPAWQRGREWVFVNNDNVKPDKRVEGRCPVIVPRVVPGLYRQERFREINREHPVYLVEGEKDVDTLVSIGCEAFCPPHGSNTWGPEFAKPFAGRNVVVIPDNDQTGFAHAERVMGSLIVAGAAGIKYLKPGWNGYTPPEHGGDVTDWLRQAAKSLGYQRISTELRPVLAGVVSLTSTFRNSAKSISEPVVKPEEVRVAA